MYNLNITKIEKWYFLLEYQFKDLSFVDILKKEIDEKVGEFDFKTNVKGRMTKFEEFVNSPILKKLLEEATPVSNVLSIKDSKLIEAWGNILKEDGNVTEHTHGSATISGILYLTEGGPGTYFREFNKTVEEKIGKIVFFSGMAYHSVIPTRLNKDRYTISFNFQEIKPWDNK
jgi:hypothetical protein